MKYLFIVILICISCSSAFDPAAASDQFLTGKCYTCGGTGQMECPKCGGSGLGTMCYACEGAGRISVGGGPWEKCYACGGRGYNKCYKCQGRGLVKCIYCNGKGYFK